MTSNPTKADRDARAFAHIEKMPRELRKCVHEFSYPVVNACLMFGVKQPNHIRQLVREIWEGPRNSRQNRRENTELDWLLFQSGAEITSSELRRVLLNSHRMIVEVQPTNAMIEASMEICKDHSVSVTKREKHRMRLLAALKAAGV